MQSGHILLQDQGQVPPFESNRVDFALPSGKHPEPSQGDAGCGCCVFPKTQTLPNPTSILSTCRPDPVFPGIACCALRPRRHIPPPIPLYARGDLVELLRTTLNLRAPMPSHTFLLAVLRQHHQIYMYVCLYNYCCRVPRD